MIPNGLAPWADLAFWTDDWPAISDRLDAETCLVFPPEAARFRALKMIPPDQVRVVLLGQDPYHTAGKADGLAFSIPQGFGGRLDSLGNIIKELKADLDVDRSKTSLEDWAAQGVLLLNTALTVREGAAKSHATWGWDSLVRQVIARLEDAPRAFLLWGSDAQRFAPQSPHHFVLMASHPSPLSAHRGFFGSAPFSKVNAWLKDRGQPEINWADPA